MNKLIKGLLIGGGVMALMDITDMCAKGLMFNRISLYDEDLCEEMTTDMLTECADYPTGKLAATRSKMIVKLKEMYDEIM